jgi:hypothetical protein
MYLGGKILVQGFMLEETNHISVAAFAPREGRKCAYSRESVGDTDLDLARSTDEVVPSVVDIF